QDKLTIGGTVRGMRGYLCLRGGVQAPEILQSHSSLEPLRSGMRLACMPGAISSRFLVSAASLTRQRGIPESLAGASGSDDGILQRFAFSASAVNVLRVIDGLQADWFRAGEFLRQEMTISPASNRMGLRLQGRPLTMPERELVSEPVCPGAVQVTRD